MTNRATALIVGGFCALSFALADRARAVGVPLQNATATLSQTAPGVQPASQSIDGTLTGTGGWAILTGVGGTTTAQTIVWETASDLGIVGPQNLTFELYQNFGSAVFLENIGRFRLSATNANRSDFADGLNSGGDVTTSWTVLTPSGATATNGNTLTVLGDNSILAGNAPSASVVYTVTATTALTGITGFRLEVLEDPSLPNNGPGMASDGNFVLTEFVVVPEPSALVMLSAGSVAALLLSMGRRRRQSR